MVLELEMVIGERYGVDVVFYKVEKVKNGSLVN
jgi:hypothetical protein